MQYCGVTALHNKMNTNVSACILFVGKSAQLYFKGHAYNKRVRLMSTAGP